MRSSMSAWPHRLMHRALLGVILVTLAGPFRATSASGSCGETKTSTEKVIVRACMFVFKGDPVLVRGYALGGGTLKGELGVRRPPDVYMQISVSRYGAGPNLMRCADRTDIIPAPTDPAAVCFAEKSLMIAPGTLLQCYVNLFNSADRDRTTKFGYSCGGL